MMKREYNFVLDILRIVATAMVFMVHLIKNITIPEGKISDLMIGFCSKGANGVPILFCLSGYLIWSGIQKVDFCYTDYLKKRVQKIIPAYWCVLIIHMLLGIIPISLGVIRYFTFTNAIIPSSNFNIYNNMSGFWAMSSFMLFYLVAPVINKYIRSLKDAVKAVVICFAAGKLFDFVLEFCLVSVGADEVGFMLASFPIGNMYFFLLGVVAYWSIKEKKEMQGILGALCCVTILIGFNKLDYPLWTLLAFMVIIISTNVVVQVFGRVGNIIRYLSLISYEVYLIHFLIIKLNTTAQIGEKHGAFVFVVFTVSETLIAAMVLHFLVDKGITKRYQQGK